MPSDSAKAKGITPKSYGVYRIKPFSVVEDAGFQGLMVYLESRCTLPSRRLSR